jgi:HupE / UreJ protein
MTRHLHTRIALLLFCVAPVLFAPMALAHKASTSYLHLRADGAQLTGRMDLAVRDLDFALQVDANGDGAITWGELKAARPSIEEYLARRLTVSSAGNHCPLAVDDLRVVEHSDGNYAVLTLSGACPSRIAALDIDYELLFDVDALHRGLAAIEFASPRGVESQSALFAPDAHVLHFAPAASTVTRVFRQYFKAGLFHVWSGLDHLLFLAGLFLPAVLRRIHGRWTPVSNLRTALRDTALIVTAFTIAHACTLSLAALGTFTVPSRVVESAVALTVLFAGLNNLVPMVYRDLFWLSGVFGLIHGAAVASALIDLGLPATGRVWALLAFNVGVEAAQLSLLALVIFPAYAMRNTRFYRFGVLSPGSAVVAIVGLCWFVERAFGVYFGVPLP